MCFRIAPGGLPPRRSLPHRRDGHAGHRARSPTPEREERRGAGTEHASAIPSPPGRSVSSGGRQPLAERAPRQSARFACRAGASNGPCPAGTAPRTALHVPAPRRPEETPAAARWPLRPSFPASRTTGVCDRVRGRPTDRTGYPRTRAKPLAPAISPRRAPGHLAAGRSTGWARCPWEVSATCGRAGRPSRRPPRRPAAIRQWR